MNTDRIDFISAYCDGWCERCAYTSRCSSFAVRAALAMCGDARDAIELAVGAPHPVEPQAGAGPSDGLDSLANVELNDEELAEFCRRHKARDHQVRSTPVMQSAWAVGMVAHRWLAARADAVRATADSVLGEALEIAQHDSFLITVKVARAVRGRYDHEHGESFDDDPVQNDRNGSAKLALICLERSEAAWQIIGAATGDETPAAVSMQMADLRREVERSFPDARAFIRPGFDEPWR